MAYRTFSGAQKALQHGETTVTQVVSSYFDAISENNPHLNVFLSTQADAALKRAGELDQLLASGTSLPLAGMVMGIKDVICIKNGPVTCGSHILEGFESLYNATVVDRLQKAGAIFIGKTNCDEFAMGSSTENSFFGPTRNPVNPDYVPGGSSGGSAAAIAAHMCNTSLGSDTGGSIRQPASYCGVVGLKPTYGRVSRFGLVAYASSFDCIGPFAHTVSDAATVLQTIAGFDPNDATSAPVPVPEYSESFLGNVEGVRIGLPVEYYQQGLDDGVRALIDQQIARLREAGAQIVEVSLPHTEYGIAAYYVLAMAEASSNLARYDGVRYGFRADMKAVKAQLDDERQELERKLQQVDRAGEPDRVSELKDLLSQKRSMLHELYVHSRTGGFGDEVKRRIMLGTYVLSSGYYDAYYGKAQRVRMLIRKDFEAVFEKVDVLLAPASPTTAFALGSKTSDPLEMYLIDIYTVTANLAGIPGLVVPVGNHENGLPVGLQLLAPHFGEETLFRVGDVCTDLAGTKQAEIA